MNAVRFADDNEDAAVIEGVLCPVGGGFDGRDSYGTYFTRSTDFCLPWFPEGSRPVLYNHGTDPDLGTEPIGRITSLRMTDKGLWMQAQIDKRAAYFDEIKELVKAGQLGLSSGAMAHLVDVDERSGEIKRWPVIEGTTTPTESNLLATIDAHTFKSHCRAAGIELPEDTLERIDVAAAATRAVWSAATVNDFPDSSFAYVEPGDKDEEGKTTPRSKRHLPYKGADGKPDAAHVRNALARLDQTDIPAAAKASARRKLVAAAKKLGIAVSDENDTGRSAGALRLADDGDDGADDEQAGSSYDGSYEDLIDDLRALLNPANPFTSYGYTAIMATYPASVIACSCDGDGEETYWTVPWTLGDDGEPTLGTPQQVEQTYTPVSRSGQAESSRSSSIGPLTLDAQHFIRQAAALARRTQDLGDRRIREGRVLSAANRTLLKDAHGRMGEAHRALGDLLDATEKQADDAARAARWSDPVWRRQQFALLDLYAATCRT